MQLICGLLFSWLMVRSSSAAHPPSPCPDIFSYEGAEPEYNRWYGEISLRTDENLVGIRLDIELDRPADLMVSWLGEIMTYDNVKFSITNWEQKLRPGPAMLSRIMVKFNQTTGSPKVRFIRMNGRKVCPEDSSYVSEYVETTPRPQKPLTTRRPDPEFGETIGDEYPVNGNVNNNNNRPDLQPNSNYNVRPDSQPIYNNNNNNNNRPSSQTNSNNYNNRPSSQPIINNNNNNSPNTDYSPNVNNNRPVYKPAPATTTEEPYTTRKPTKVTTTTTRIPYEGNNRPNNNNNNNNSPNTVSLHANAMDSEIHGVIDELIQNNQNTNKTVIITVIENIPQQNRPINGGGQPVPVNNNGQSRPTNNNNNNNYNNYNNNNNGAVQPRPENNQPVQSRPESNRPVQSRPENNGAGQSRPENNGAGQSRPENNVSGQSKPNGNQQTSNQKPNNQGNTAVSYPSGSNSQQLSQDQLTCGDVKLAVPLVTAGQSTHRGQWPWHVALYMIEGINLSYHCGGSLVSKNKVITAAHCVTSKQTDAVMNSTKLVIYLGKYHQLQYSDELGVQTKQVIRINVYPNYNSSNYLGDIAVLTLSSDAEFTDFVTPVCLWDERSDNLNDIVDKEGTVVGWGFDENDTPTEELKMAKMPVVSHQTCLWSYPQFYSEFTSDKTFCAGFRNGTSVCNGDSGGGMVFNRNSRWHLRGIVSITVAKEGLRVCDTRHYVVFTDVSKYLDFIKKNLVR